MHTQCAHNSFQHTHTLTCRTHRTYAAAAARTIKRSLINSSFEKKKNSLVHAYAGNCSNCKPKYFDRKLSTK